MANSSNKQTYSLISVDKAKDRSSVEAEGGVEVEFEAEADQFQPNDAQNEVKATKTEHFDQAEAVEETKQPKWQQASKAHQASALDDMTEEDLQGNVPLENVHKVIIVILLLSLLVFGVYFFVFM